MLTFLMAAALAGPALDAPRVRLDIGVFNGETRGFFDPGRPAGLIVGPSDSRGAAATRKSREALPECAIRVRPADPSVDAPMARDVTPRVDVEMAVSGGCRPAAAE